MRHKEISRAEPDVVLAGNIRQRYIDDGVRVRLPSEREMAAAFGLSRTVIRRALQRLSRAGLIVTPPGGRIRYIRRLDSLDKAGSALFAGQNAFRFARTDSAARVRVLAMDLCLGSPENVLEAWNAWAKAFQKRYPDIHVDLLPWPIEQADQNGALCEADVLEVPISSMADAPPGLVQGLGELATADAAFKWNRFDRRLVPECGRRRNPMAIPFGAVVPCLLANARIWEEVVRRPVPMAWSWDEFLTVAEGVFRQTRQPVFALEALNDITASTGHDPASFSSAAALEHTGPILSRLLKVSRIALGHAPFSLVAEGEVAFYPARTTVLSSLSMEQRARVLALPFPCDPQGHLLCIVMGLGLSSQCVAPLECWQWIRYLTALPRQRALGRLHHFIPAVKAAQPSLLEAPAGLGDLRFLLRALDRCRLPAISYAQLNHLESHILGPELYAWHTGRQTQERAFSRIGILAGLLVSRRAAPAG